MEIKKAMAYVVIAISLLSTTAVAQYHPIGVGGYVRKSGVPVPGATVVVQNINTGDSVTTTTNSFGLYAVGIFAHNGDVIVATATHGSDTGTASRNANTGIVTNWLNISIGNATNATYPIKARFSYTPRYPHPGENINFIDSSDGDIIEWIWDFGDGSTATGKNQVHKYISEGSYKVTLRVRDIHNNTDSTTKTVVVSEYAENPFIPEPQPPVNPYGYTIKSMCDLLRISNMTKSNSKMTVVYIDSGVSDRQYNIEGHIIDMSKIQKKKVFGDNLYDEYGHGTATGAILQYILDTELSDYTLICIKAFDYSGKSTTDNFVKAIEMAKSLHPDVVSISAGAMPQSNDIFSKKADELIDSGIIVVASAGNAGPATDTILSPAINKYVIAVGAENPELTILDLNDDTICPWSSRGSSTQKKPDVSAPGESIIVPWGATEEKILSGTSFSCPFVAGGVAVAISENKLLYDIDSILYSWNKRIVYDAVMDSLKKSCYSKQPEYAWGKGIPVFTDMTSILFWHLLILLLIPILIIVAIAITIYSYDKYSQKKKQSHY